MHNTGEVIQMANRKRVCVTLPEESWEAVRILAAEVRRTVPNYISQLVRVHLREVEQDPDKKIK